MIKFKQKITEIEYFLVVKGTSGEGTIKWFVFQNASIAAWASSSNFGSLK